MPCVWGVVWQMKNRKTVVQEAGRSLFIRAKAVAKKTVRELYWSFAFDAEEDAKRYVVFHFKKDAPDDVVLARVQQTGTQLGMKLDEVTRHKKPEQG